MNKNIILGLVAGIGALLLAGYWFQVSKFGTEDGKNIEEASLHESYEVTLSSGSPSPEAGQMNEIIFGDILDISGDKITVRLRNGWDGEAKPKELTVNTKTVTLIRGGDVENKTLSLDDFKVGDWVVVVFAEDKAQTAENVTSIELLSN